MNSKVDFAAGGIVIHKKCILLVRNRLTEEYKNDYAWKGNLHCAT